MADANPALGRARRVFEEFPGSDYSRAETEWLRAVTAERHRLGRVTLTPAETLALARRLGYRREKPP